METRALSRWALIGVLTLLMAAPPWVLAQGTGGTGTGGTGRTYSQQELDQLLAPIALYPDALLAQVLVGATYPDQVVEAARWIKANSYLKGEALNNAVDQHDWDLSVKALIPFPDVLAMMSDKRDWTEKVGDAFLADEDGVMDTVQSLRAKARAQGNLKDTKEQKVVVEKEIIQIEPVNPQVVYIPTYDPVVVYGPWWYPAYPPYYVYPPGAVWAAGVVGFAAGVAVGAAWCNAWGHWDWYHHNVNINVNRNININHNYVSARNVQTSNWSNTAANRRATQTSRTQADRQRAGQKGVGTADSRRDYRGYGQQGKAGGAAEAGRQVQRQPGAATGTRPTADSALKGLQQREGRGAGGYDRGGKTAFEGSGRGSQARMNSERGAASRSTSPGGSYRSGTSSYRGAGGGGHGGGGSGYRGGGGGGGGGGVHRGGGGGGGFRR